MDGSLNEAERPEQSPRTANRDRQVTLSVVIDGRLDAARARQVAVLTHRLGLAGAWLRYPWWPPPRGKGTSETEPAGLLAVLAVLASGAQLPLGLLVDADTADPVSPADDGLDRLVQAAGFRDAGLAAGLRIALVGPRPALAWWRGLIARRPSLAAAQLALPAADGGRPGAAVFVPCAPGRNLAGAVAAAAAAAAVGGRPVLAEVTVSVGRTAAEARARADADELFTRAGHPAEQGLFGTLEECQAAAARLAQAGATELVCHLPLASDLPDVLAQLRSIAIGAEVLRSGEPPSAAPPPPAGWGGRRSTA